MPVPLLKAPSPADVKELFAYLDSHYSPELALGNKAIIAVFVESGLRLFELSPIKPEDIHWSEGTIRVWGKGRKEGKAPFGQTSEVLLREWLSQYNPNGDNIWGIDRGGIQVMLKRLHQATGITCNPHSFRRAFACILRKAGVDSMTIKDLGGGRAWKWCRDIQGLLRFRVAGSSISHRLVEFCGQTKCTEICPQLHVVSR